MKIFRLFVIGLCVLTVLSCSTKTGTGGLIGAGGGAVLGAIIGKMAGNTAVGAAIGAAVGTGAGVLIGKKMDKVKAEAEKVQNAQVETITDKNGLDAVKMTFDSGILFDTGKADLSSASKLSLQQLSAVLKSNTTCDVSIQGYTDNQGWRNSTPEESALKNKALSLDRATSVSSYLQSLGISTQQIKSVEGLGEANPVDNNETAEGQKKNRRVEIYLYASEQMIKQAEAGTLN